MSAGNSKDKLLDDLQKQTEIAQKQTAIAQKQTENTQKLVDAATTHFLEQQKDPELKAELKEAKAELKEAEAKLSLAKAELAFVGHVPLCYSCSECGHRPRQQLGAPVVRVGCACGCA